jgi:Spy/CpxP family protein refolding chaperone
MKSPLKSILPALGLALLSAGPFARAQDTPPPQAPAGGGDEQAPPPPPTHRRGRGLSPEQLKAKLNLTDDQFAKVSSIVAASREQLSALRDDDSISDDDKRDKMRSIMKSQHDQIRAILTPAQQKIFDTLAPHGPPPPPPPPSQ